MNAPAATETELKLAFAAAAVPNLRRQLEQFGKGRVQRLDSLYYDTKKLDLARAGIALRLRRAGRRWLQTLKTESASAALSQRGEWEASARVSDGVGRLDLARFADTPLGEWRRAHPRARLTPRFRTRFRRTLWFAHEGAIEIALDEGEIVCADRRLALLELELELKSGRRAALWELALELAGDESDGIALLPLTESKAARGVRLARGEGLAPVKAGAKAFTAGLNARLRVEAVLRSVVATGTTVLLANVHRLSVQDDPEFIHQARVAVRRMRSALRLFADEVEFPPPLADGLRWIGVELGQARDLDVLAEHTLPAIAAQTGADALGPVRPSVEQMREAARQRARAAAASPRFARLALLLLQWADAEAGRSRTATLRSFAPKALRRAQRRLIDAARFFATAAPERQHRVRILAKRLRYALDLAAVALPDTCEYSDKLSALQDVLGELNDAAIALELFSQSQLPPEAIAAARSALTQRRLELSLKGEAALSELSEMPVPWR